MKLTKKQKKQIRHFMEIFLYDLVDRYAEEATESFINVLEISEHGDDFILKIESQLTPPALHTIRLLLKTQQSEL